MMSPSVFRRPAAIIRFEDTARVFGVCDGEIARVFSVAGELLREYRGFCETEIPESDRPILENGILTYTHPLDTTFSRKDIVLASYLRLAEIRVIGRSYVYSLKPPTTGWPSPELLGTVYDRERKDPEFVARIESLKKSPEFRATSKDPEMDIFRIRRDLLCRNLAETFGLRYRKAPFASAAANELPSGFRYNPARTPLVKGRFLRDILVS